MDDSDASTSSPIIPSRKFSPNLSTQSPNLNNTAAECQKYFDISNGSKSGLLSESLINAFEADEPTLPENDQLCVDLFETGRGNSIFIPKNSLETASKSIMSNFETFSKPKAELEIAFYAVL